MMKLIANVYEVKSSRERLSIRMRAKSLPNESIYSTVLHEIEVPDTETARKTYFIGRRVVLNVLPE